MYVQDNKEGLPLLDDPSDRTLTKPDGTVADGGERYNVAYGSGWIIRTTRFLDLSPDAKRARRDILFCPADRAGIVPSWGTFVRFWYPGANRPQDPPTPSNMRWSAHPLRM